MRTLSVPARNAGMTLVELLISVTIAFVILGILLLAGARINRSMWANERFLREVGNENRMMDSIAADLRRSVRVSILNGSTFKNIEDTKGAYYNINDTNTLVITIPDYYGSNTPDNTAGSAYKTPRYSRSTLNTSITYNTNGIALVNGTVPWADAQIWVRGKRATRFAPRIAVSDELQVRYYTAPRSSSDSTLCLFRSEYPPNAISPSSTREVAERISDSRSTTLLSITGRNGGSVLRLQSAFTPTFRIVGSTSSTTAYVDVNIRNPRRD